MFYIFMNKSQSFSNSVFLVCSLHNSFLAFTFSIFGETGRLENNGVEEMSFPSEEIRLW